MNRPTYYGPPSIQAIDAIEAWQLGFRLGNVVKYVCRAGRKDRRTRKRDLEKALWYLQRELDKT